MKLRLRIPRWRGRVALLAGSCLGCLLALELALRLVSIPEPWVLPLDPHGYQDYFREREVPNPLIRFDPELGFTLTPHARHLPGAGSNIVNTNSRGVRGVKEHGAKVSGIPRIVTLGDSFTFGECVEDHQTYPAVLGQFCESCEVINLGVFAYGLDQILLTLQRTREIYDPDVVVLGYYPGDARRVRHRFFSGAPKPRFTLRDGKLKVADRPRTPQEYRRSWIGGYFLRDAWSTSFRKRHVIDLAEEVSRKILEEFVAEGTAGGATVVFVYIPDEDDCLWDERLPDPLFVEACESLDVVCLDPTPAIRSFLSGDTSAAERFECGGHYDPALNRLIARELSAQVP